MPNKTVALLGVDPFTIDFTDPSYASFAGLGAEKIRADLDHDVRELTSRDFDPLLVLTVGDVEVAEPYMSAALRSKRWDYVLIGAGVRTVTKNFHLFELLINLARELAPQAKICFNTGPTDSTAAVMRWIEP